MTTTDMRNKTHNIAVLSAALVMTLIIIFSARENDKKLRYKTFFHSESGWGYDIFLKDKIVIHQPNVPGKSGFVGFESQKEAEEMAAAIINKIEKGRVPVLSTFDPEKKAGAE